MNLLAARKGTGFDRFDAAVLAAYAGVLAWAIHHHQPFVDEAQAWVIARDSSLHELLFRRLHYEGCPALWPLILWVATRLHLPYAGLNWLAGFLALPGVFLLLRHAPFPRIFRWLFPFTFFLQYQYAVIARPYVLFPGLLFALCILFTLSKPRPIFFALVAGLLVNISFQAALIAAVFSLLYLRNLWLLPGHSTQRASSRQIVAAVGLFVLLSALSAAVAFPAPDVVLVSAPSKAVVAKPNAILLKLVPEERMPSGAAPLDPPLESIASGKASQNAADYPAIVRAAIATIILGANAACFPIAKSNLLAVCFLACMLLWLWSRRCLYLALPFFIAVLFSVQIVVFDYHTGLFLLALVAAVWIALESFPPTRRTPWIQPLSGGVAIAVVLLQIGWSTHCIRSETFAPYDPGRETEAFLVGNFPGKRIAGFSYESVSTQAYAKQNLFFNQPKAFWLWSIPVSIDRRRAEALAQHPDVVVAGDLITREELVFNQWITILPAGTHPYLPMLQFWQQHGYRITHRFCGDRFVRMGVSDTFCEVILEPVPGYVAVTLSSQGPR